MSTFTTPKVRRGVAGEIVASTVTHHDGEADTPVAFHGSAYGGPVVMSWGPTRMSQTFVSDATRDRIGITFHTDPAEWVRRFFADRG